MPNDGTTSLGNENAEALDKLHCFGSRWFCVQMQEAFNTQSAILKEIAFKHHSNPAIKSVFPLVHGLHTASDAISLLRRDGLLNEAHVLMRLMTERAINLCYCLVAPSNSNTKPPNDTTDSKPVPKQLMADELIEVAKGFRFSENYDSQGLEMKINLVAANTKIPLNFLRLVISSHYPQASLALGGSAAGAVFHLCSMTEEVEDHISHNFAVLLFSGVSLLNYVIKELGAHGIPEILIKDSDAASDVANKTMLKGVKPVVPNVRDAYGWWQTLSDHEYLAAKKLAPSLREFETAFSACIEAGMEVPMLAKADRTSQRLRISALYLKRLLNDVRSLWLMMRQGNTSQAGSIAASLFETTLLIQCVAENEERAVRLTRNPTGKWPWDIRAMCGFVNRDEARRDGRQYDEKGADADYAQYAWLCQFKHPTLGYVGHDSGSTHVAEEGYVVMPFPDAREDDWPVKRKVLLISLFSAVRAIKAFARGGQVKDATPGEISFNAKLKTARDLVEKHLSG
jgi:hypothetical protein